MDAIKLKNSCICGNTLPYPDCCGRFAQVIGQSDAAASRKIGGDEVSEAERKWADFRHVFHELYMYLFPLRNLYQAYWEKLSQEDYPHHLLMADGEYGRAVVANFFWDYSVQFSDSRPILRAARDLEGKDLRAANDFRQWSLSALCPAFVVEADSHYGHLRLFGAEKLHRVAHGGLLPEPGTYAAVRLLSYRGEEYVHPAVWRFRPRSFPRHFWKSLFETFTRCWDSGPARDLGLTFNARNGAAMERCFCRCGGIELTTPSLVFPRAKPVLCLHLACLPPIPPQLKRSAGNWLPATPCRWAKRGSK